ncbi:MAG: hypothetical protein IT379_39745 [Deltaproteobacteria bacterium]|nr:hypothetical protein [Deltaproteobacteria bacterium]
MDKRGLSERDVCTKFIGPAIVARGCDVQSQVRENVHLTKGRVIVRGRLVTRGSAKSADHVLCFKPNVRLAIIEAKTTTIASATRCSRPSPTRRRPVRLSSNGDGFLFHDRTGRAAKVEEHLALDQFPPPDELWRRYCAWKGITPNPSIRVLGAATRLDTQDELLAACDRLLKVCDELEARLAHVEERASKLVEAVVQELVE